MEQSQSTQPIEEVKLEVKRMIFNSWKNEVGKDNGTCEPIGEEPKHDMLPTETTEEGKIINVEAVTESTEKEDEVKIINVEESTESTEKEEQRITTEEEDLMHLTAEDKEIIEQVENIIAPAPKSKRTKQKLVTDDKPSPVIKSNVKAKLAKPKTVTLAVNQVLQIKLQASPTTFQKEFI